MRVRYGQSLTYKSFQLAQKVLLVNFIDNVDNVLATTILMRVVAELMVYRL